MARVIPSGLVQDIVGSAGAYTYSKWRGLHYLRLKAASVSNPNTVPQQLYRSVLAAKSRAWSALTPEQRALWAEYAQLQGSARTKQKLMGKPGIVKRPSNFLTGFNAFVAINQRLASGPAAPANVPPLYKIPEYVILSAVFAPGPPVVLSILGSFSAATAKDYFFQVWFNGKTAAMHKYLIVSESVSAGELMVTVSIETVRVGHGDDIQEVPWEDWLGPLVSGPNTDKVIGKIQSRVLYGVDGAVSAVSNSPLVYYKTM